MLKLNDAQRRAYEHDEGPALCLAAAGSGKTTVLVNRIVRIVKEGLAPADRICAITFSKAAAMNMQTRVAQLLPRSGMQISTFHSLGMKIIRQEIEHVDQLPINDSSKLIVWNNEKIWALKEIMGRRMKDGTPGLDCDEDIELSDALRMLSSLKRNLITPDLAEQYLIEEMGEGVVTQMYIDMYKMYERKKNAAGAIDFDDMILYPTLLFRDNMRIRRRWQKSFDFVLVDECQDNNPIQTQLYDYLCERHNNLFIVGDDFQSIYSFMDSSPDNSIYSFEKRYPGATVYKLEENYRSSDTIIQAANRITEHMNNPFDKWLKPTQDVGAEISVKQYVDHSHQALATVEEIQAIASQQDDPEYKEMCILYRTNAQSRALEEALVREAIPYVIHGSSGFYNRREVKDMINMLRAAFEPNKYSKSVQAVINIASDSFPFATRRLGKGFHQKVWAFAKAHNMSYYQALQKTPMTSFNQKGVRDFMNFISAVQNQETLSEKLRYIKDRCYIRYMRHEHGISEGDDDPKLELLDEVVNSAAMFKNEYTYLAFVNRMQDQEEKADDPNFNGVQLMTIHRSKGLEFDHVFVTGMNNGTLPHAYSGMFVDGEFVPVDVSEERRLAYVAATRARHCLYLSATQQNLRGEPAQPSMFIDEFQLTMEVIELKDEDLPDENVDENMDDDEIEIDFD